MVKHIFWWLLIAISIIILDAVKIGMSKPMATSTTMQPNTTMEDTTIAETTTTENLATQEMTTDEATTRTISSSSSTSTSTSATTTTTTTTMTATTPELAEEPEWPEFPPKIHTTTKKPTAAPTLPSLFPTRKAKATKTPTTSTKAPTDQNNNTDLINPQFIYPLSKDRYCFCNLMLHHCDINCCCDPDCPLAALKVFKCLQSKDLDIQERRFEDFKFHHGLPSCAVNDGWLCVFRTNLPQESEMVLPNYSDTSAYYTWPNMLNDEGDPENRDFYKAGDVLQIINMNTRNVIKLELPLSLKPPYCQGMEPITHLRDQTRTCLHTSITNLKVIEKNIMDLDKKYQIFKKPMALEDLQNDKQFKNQIGKVNVRQCYETLQQCKHMNTEESQNVGDDKYILHKIRINLMHNFTNIEAVNYDLCYKEMEKQQNKISEFWLTYEIKFINETLKDFLEIKGKKSNIPRVASGALGYRLGKPLIVSKYIPINNSLPMTETNRVIEYFSADVNELHSNSINVFKRQQGLCHLTSPDHKESINYGINLSKQCYMRLGNETLLHKDAAKTNFTQICLNLQNEIHKHLFDEDLSLIENSNYFISQLGKPRNFSSKWLALNVINMEWNPVYGEYMENSHSFICRNILLNINYEFFMGSHAVDEIRNQNVLKYARLTMGDRHDLEFALDEVIEIPIGLNVRFYSINDAASASSHLYFKYALYLLTLTLVMNCNKII